MVSVSALAAVGLVVVSLVCLFKISAGNAMFEGLSAEVDADADASANEPSSCQATAEFRDSMKLLQHNQYRANCSTACYVKVAWMPGEANGFGSRVSLFAAALNIAFQRGCILVMPKAIDWEWDGKMFLPISNCAPGPASDIHTIQEREFIDRFSKHMNSKPPGELSPMLWQHVAYSFLLRPTFSFATEVASVQKTIGWHSECQNSVVAMHIRHGDKGMEAAVFGFGDYLAALNLALKKTNSERPKCIFVATDDPDPSNVPRSSHIGGYRAIGTWITNPETLAGLKQQGKDLFNTAKLRSEAYRKSKSSGVLVDVMLLARARSLVFTYSSNFGQVGMLLNPRHVCMPAPRQLPSLIPLDTIYHYRESKGASFLVQNGMPTSRASSTRALANGNSKRETARMPWGISHASKAVVERAVFCDKRCGWEAMVGSRCNMTPAPDQQHDAHDSSWWLAEIQRDSAIRKQMKCFRPGESRLGCWPFNSNLLAKKSDAHHRSICKDAA